MCEKYVAAIVALSAVAVCLVVILFFVNASRVQYKTEATYLKVFIASIKGVDNAKVDVEKAVIGMPVEPAQPNNGEVRDGCCK